MITAQWTPGNNKVEVHASQPGKMSILYEMSPKDAVKLARDLLSCAIVVEVQ